MGRSLCRNFDLRNYFICAVTLAKVVFSLVPRPLTTAMIATEMPAAIRPYSMAVAPELSFTKRTKRFFIGNSMIHTWLSELIQGLDCLQLPWTMPKPTSEV